MNKNTMHQIFYIDIDEEITSVIDRLRKAKTNDVYFVVPKRSLVLQSGVSLKLLKKEGTRIKKRVTVVTQDQQGGVRAEKSGLRVLATMDGLEDSSMAHPEPMIREKSVSEEAVIEHVKKPHRLEKIGTKDFYGVETETDYLEHKPNSHSMRKKEIIRAEPRDVFEAPREKTLNRRKKEIIREEIIENEEDDVYQEKKDHEFEEIFSAPLTQRERELNPIKKESTERKAIPNKIKKVAFIFFGLSIVILVGVGAFIFLPKATVTVGLKTGNKNLALSLVGDAKYDQVNMTDLGIPIHIIEIDDLISREFSSTGSGTATGQKAKGTVVIYNEFSASAQPLVGTTRLLTADGKLFRLAKSVVVPGTTMVDGKQQSGAIEVEVVADQAGEEYNVGPSTFSIPGFKSGPKFEKIYARSVKIMIGGGSRGVGTASSASQIDIANAKKSVEDELKKILEEKLNSGLQNGEKIFTEAEEITITESAVVSGSNIVGKFSYRVAGKMKAFAFLEKDIASLVQKKLTGENNNSGFSLKDFSFEYSQPKADFAAQKITFDLNAKVLTKSDFDAAKFKTAVLGKNEAQIRELLSQYPQIENIDLEIWPGSIIERIPSMSQRVQIEVK